MPDQPMSAIDDIGHERQRQIDDERFDARHDDRHDFGELINAALCYAAISRRGYSMNGFLQEIVSRLWPATDLVLLGAVAKSGAPRSESEIAMAYACGYRNGQISITNRLPTLFTNEKDNAEATTCPEMVAIAAKHGFSAAQ